MIINKILFPESPIQPGKVDEVFVDEYRAAIQNGFEALIFNSDEMSTKRIKPADTLTKIIYRGWMFTPTQYSMLFENLRSKNYALINNPKEYQNCHYLPDSLAFIKDFTPKTIFQKIESETDIDTLIQATEVFGEIPVIIKDYVKSEKHYWNTACFVPNAMDKKKLYDTIHSFLDLRGTFLNEGIVIREYIDLDKIADHSKCGMPLSEEYRLFFFNHRLIGVYDYWEEGQYTIEKPAVTQFIEIAQNIDSNFFTMDIARTTSGNFTIIELGDGQVSGIPESINKETFYKSLSNQ